MFGIIYTALMTAGLVGHNIKNGIREQQKIAKATEDYKKGKNIASVYKNAHGHYHDLDTGESVMIDHINCENEGKDVYVRNKYGEPIRNLSEQIRQQKLTEAKTNRDPRRTVIEWKKGVPKGLGGYNGNPYYEGEQYKDLDTGAIYVCRCIDIPSEISGSLHSNGFYYMDVRTGLLVRETDSRKEKRRRGQYVVSEDVIEKFLKYFNEKQSREGYYLKSNIIKDRDWDGKEKETAKFFRMRNYYLNDNVASDIL